MVDETQQTDMYTR